MSLPPLDDTLPPFLAAYLPSPSPSSTTHRWVTLTYAQSLDGRIAAAPGTRTAISHLQTKTMTHYIRSKHSAILVGVNTVLADNPALNCRYNATTHTHTIRPVVLDPHYKLKHLTSTLKMVANYKSGTGLKPLLVVSSHINDLSNDDVDLLKVQPLSIPNHSNLHLPWDKILDSLSELSLNTVMIEGGATVINDLLTRPHLINSLIVTIGPVYLGNNAVPVAPQSNVKLQNVSWWNGIQDSVLAATI